MTFDLDLDLDLGLTINIIKTFIHQQEYLSLWHGIL